MYNFKHNNYHLKPKNSTIYTPPQVSEFLFKLLKDKIPKNSFILDPCSGLGSLLVPWKNSHYETLGIDLDKNSNADLKGDFFNAVNLQYWINCGWLKTPQLVLCNPPFNGRYPQLAPEIQSIENTSIAVGQVWLDKIIELFGKETPIVLFVPAGFTLNLTLESKRYLKFEQGIYPPIISRISLPKNIFEGVKFHSERLLSKRNNLQKSFDKDLEILIFNIPNLEPHYFFNHE